MGKKRKSKAEAFQIPAEYKQPARKIIQGLQQGSRQRWGELGEGRGTKATGGHGFRRTELFFR